MNTSWFVERSVYGGFKVTPAEDVFRRNIAFAQQGKPLEWFVIGQAADMTAARELERELKRKMLGKNDDA